MTSRTKGTTDKSVPPSDRPILLADTDIYLNQYQCRYIGIGEKNHQQAGAELGQAQPQLGLRLANVGI